MKTTFILTAAIATCAALSWFGPTVLDNSAESATADAAIAQHQAEIKVLRAAIEMCGSENAVAQLAHDGQWDCFNKRGQHFAQVTK